MGRVISCYALLCSSIRRLPLLQAASLDARPAHTRLWSVQYTAAAAHPNSRAIHTQQLQVRDGCCAWRSRKRPGSGVERGLSFVRSRRQHDIIKGKGPSNRHLCSSDGSHCCFFAPFHYPRASVMAFSQPGQEWHALVDLFRKLYSDVTRS
jgi:hypothetical protein